MLHRREIIKMLALLTTTASTSASGVLGSLQQIAAAKPPSAGDNPKDYKGLVCIMLNGGNDALNMVFPAPGHKEYQHYLTARQDLAVPNYVVSKQYLGNQGDARYHKQLLPIALTNTHGEVEQLTLHPGMQGLQLLAQQGQLAVIANSGVLLESGSKAQFSAGVKRKPAFLFAHNQQRKAVYSGVADNNKTTGWGGELSELATLAAYNSAKILPMGISFRGSQQWLRGTRNQGAVLAPGKPERIVGLDPQGNRQQRARSEAAQQLQAQESDDMLLRLMRGKLTSAQDLAGTLAQLWRQHSAELTVIDGYFGASKLEQQLAAVAKMMLLRDSLGMRRQIFMVELGGFDTHAGQIDKHPLLLTELSEGISHFQQALAALQLTEQVTSFTASDFGRTLAGNGSGTDHGWGAHQLVIGGAVRGGLHGQWPSMQLGSADDYRSGRLLPTTSITQINASLAAWFGATQAEVTHLFPNLSAFADGALPLFHPHPQLSL